MVNPNDAAESGDNRRGNSDKVVAEEGFAGVDGEEFGKNAENWQDDDVDGRVGVEPEEVLVENRIAALGRIEEAGSGGDIEQQHHRPGGEGGQSEELNHLSAHGGPDEDGHPEPAHSRRAHPKYRGDDIHCPHNRGNAG